MRSEGAKLCKAGALYIRLQLVPGSRFFPSFPRRFHAVLRRDRESQERARALQDPGGQLAPEAGQIRRFLFRFPPFSLRFHSVFSTDQRTEKRQKRHLRAGARRCDREPGDSDALTLSLFALSLSLIAAFYHSFKHSLSPTITQKRHYRGLQAL